MKINFNWAFKKLLCLYTCFILGNLGVLLEYPGVFILHESLQLHDHGKESLIGMIKSK